MEDNAIKNSYLNSYLNQQLSETSHDPNTSLSTIELPDNAVMEEFKNQVRSWIELDNAVRKLQHAMRERNVAKKQLTEKILRFMAKYNIEDLNAKDGSRLRYRVTASKKVVKPTEIKERLNEYFGKYDNVKELTEKIFSPPENKVQKVSLSRHGAKVAI